MVGGGEEPPVGRTLGRTGKVGEAPANWPNVEDFAEESRTSYQQSSPG